MALQKRKQAAGSAAEKEASSVPAKKLSKEEKMHAKADKPSAAAAAAAAAAVSPAAAGPNVFLVRRALGVLALALAIGSAVSEWPMYLAYEKDWKRPAIGFSLNFSITALIAVLVTCSPPVRAMKPRPGVEPKQMGKVAKNKIFAAVLLVMAAFLYGFGPFGPSGGLTVMALCAFIYLALP